MKDKDTKLLEEAYSDVFWGDADLKITFDTPNSYEPTNTVDFKTVKVDDNVWKIKQPINGEDIGHIKKIPNGYEVYFDTYNPNRPGFKDDYGDEPYSDELAYPTFVKDDRVEWKK